jgi:hypothetical protein
MGAGVGCGIFFGSEKKKFGLPPPELMSFGCVQNGMLGSVRSWVGVRWVHFFLVE